MAQVLAAVIASPEMLAAVRNGFVHRCPDDKLRRLFVRFAMCVRPCGTNCAISFMTDYPERRAQLAPLLTA
jgi:uncharacterized protein (DUF983 family)